MTMEFVTLSRSFADNPFWVDSRPTHQSVFMTILLKCAYKETSHCIQGNLVKIQAGQLCITVRKLAEWCGKWISKADVEGAIKYFVKCSFLRQEIIHGKTILTITESDVISLIKSLKINEVAHV